MDADKKDVNRIRFACIRGYSRLMLGLILSSVSLMAPGVAVAQQDELDPATLIEALGREGMGELLLHLVETEKPADPVVARQVELAGLRLEFQRVSALARGSSGPNVKALQAQAAEAFDRLAQASRSLIADHPKHDRRPIWQTDLAQDLLLDYLYGLHQSAPLFAEFGVTTREQRIALEEASGEALALLSDAKLRLFKLRGEVGRDPARSEKLQSSGLFFKLFDEYDRRRTPYFLSQVAFMVAQLPDDAPYYQNLGTTDGVRIPSQASSPAKERARLLELADRELKTFTGDIGDMTGVRDAAISLRGRVLVARGQPTQGIELFQELIDGQDRGAPWLTASLARIGALAQMGQADSALDELNQLRTDSAVIDDLRFGLLVTDMTHRVMLARAKGLQGESREAAVAQSYEPYIELLSGPIPGEQVKGLRDFIYDRWANALEDDAQSDQLPPVVRLAVSQVLRQQGQEQLEEAQAANDTQQLADAKQTLKRAIDLAGSLTDKSVDPAMRSEAMFNQAMAMHWLEPKDPANRLELSAILTDLADQMPSQPVAEDAIAAAVLLLRELHQVVPTPTDVQQAYERAVGVLFSKFPVSEAADGERLYYGYAVLQADGRYSEAVDVYERVPFDHPDYFQAQRQALISLSEVYREAKPTDRPRAMRGLESAMRRVVTEAEPVMDSQVNPDRARSARRAAATVALIRAGLALSDKDYDKVLSAVEGFEQAYPGEDDLIAQVLEYRIVALTDSGEHEALAVEAKRMLADYPDQAATVIDRVLSDADLRIERLEVQAATADSIKREQYQQEAGSQADAAAVLSKYLLEWAQTQALDAEQMMPFEVIRAKMLRLSGQTESAADILSRLIHDFPSDAQVMLEYAQVLYAKGDTDSLIESVRFLDRLITGLGQPYPREWWVAWMRRLQINDQLQEGTADIPLRVRQLRMTDPSLGGPVTKRELERLEFKYAK